ncbi:MAG: tetratricopeptide repeat protein, partial [Actinomycetota bacterium]|nr:tetratricopeptide repeat protein [Actinomycetota bacterium]
PTGSVTFLFTDIEGSTRLLQHLQEAFREVMEDHIRVIREAIAEAGGVEVRTMGDAFFAVFPAAPEAVAAAEAAQRALFAHRWPEDAQVRVRMGLHTGQGILGGDDYLGLDVHRAARIASAAHGGQVVLSGATKALVEQALRPELALRDLGEHRLKDLAHPERLFQLLVPGLPADFPPLRTLSAVPNNLPVQLTSFVGREDELARATALLRTTRLLTLTGPGGVGKTRLALQAAAEAVEEFPDGTFFVDLAPIHQPELVPAAIAGPLGLTDAGAPPMDRLRSHLSDRRLLLLLDNFEQVLEAAPRVAELLRAAPQLRVLATSRAPLHVSGEQEFPVPPLQAPEPERAEGPQELAGSEAVALFVERAAAVSPDFALTPDNAQAVARITARLDGLPLAIELAAARVKLLSPHAIADRLAGGLSLLAGGSRDLPARQRALVDTIAWSYQLLDEPVQRLLRRLAVFAGGASLSFAEEVCGPAEELGMEVLDGLGLLVDHSLVRRQEPNGEPRFGMLETIRDFARRLLDESEEATRISRRHAGAFLRLAEEAEPHLTAVEQLEWLDLLDREHDNLRAALAWATREGEAEIALRLGGALWRFWQIRGHLEEAADRLDQALQLRGGSPRARAGALEAAGGVAYWQVRMEDARRFYEESLSIARSLDDPAAVAHALYNLSFPHSFGGDSERAGRLLDESRNIYQALGDRAGVAKMSYGMGMMYHWAGDYQQAQSHFQASLALSRELDDPSGVGWALGMLGWALVRQGDHRAARPYLEEGLQLAHEKGYVSETLMFLEVFASLAVSAGELERGLRLIGATSALRRSRGVHSLVEMTVEGNADALQGLPKQQVEALVEEGRWMELEEAVAYTLGDPPRRWPAPSAEP